MLMLPREEGSEEKEKNAGEKRQKIPYFLKTKSQLVYTLMLWLGGNFL